MGTEGKDAHGPGGEGWREGPAATNAWGGAGFGTPAPSALPRGPRGQKHSCSSHGHPRAVARPPGLSPSPLGLHFSICRMVMRFLLPQGRCDRQGRVTPGQALLNGAHGRPGVSLPVPHPRGRRQGGPPSSRAGLSCVIRLQRGGRSHGHPRSSWGQNILENESGRIQGGDAASQVPAGLGGTECGQEEGGRLGSAEPQGQAPRARPQLLQPGLLDPRGQHRWCGADHTMLQGLTGDRAQGTPASVGCCVPGAPPWDRPLGETPRPLSAPSGWPPEASP